MKEHILCFYIQTVITQDLKIKSFNCKVKGNVE